MLCVVGEALIDLIATGGLAADGTREYSAHPGGSPYNVAIGLSRLGRHTALQARISEDAFGRQLRAHAAAHGVDLTLAVAADQPSTLAVVSVDEGQDATYDFYVTGTADWAWTAAELALAPQDVEWIHTGSLASWLMPGADVVAEHVRSRRIGAGPTISYDPNVRPNLMPERGQAVHRIEANVALADLVKASSQDLAWLYPGRDIESALWAWLELGPRLVVVTDGDRGVYGVGHGASQVAFEPARAVNVVDTVGAGDAFMSGLIDAAVLTPRNDWGSTEQVAALLREASLVAALTVSRAGANPPTRAELLSAKSQFGY